MVAGAGQLSVEVVFALPDQQALVPLTIEAGATVQQAIDGSRIAVQFPGYDLERCAVGIWGRPADRGHCVEDGDRIEIYRALMIDPREARRRLARTGRTMSRHEDTTGG